MWHPLLLQCLCKGSIVTIKKERNEKVDFHRAVDFYETVFGVQLPVFECEEEKMACFTEEGETVGAIFHAPDYLPSE